MKVFFIGDMRAPFIREDLKLIESLSEVVGVFDLGKYYFSARRIIIYQIWCLNQLYRIFQSRLVWIWFADYQVIPFVLMAKLLRKPVVVTIGGWEVCADKEIGYGGQLNPLRGAATRWVMRNASVCIVPSFTYRKKVLEVEPKTKAIIIYHTIDASLCDDPLPKKDDVATTAYCTSSTERLKGIDVFREAIKFGGILGYTMKALPHDEMICNLKRAKVYCQLGRHESFGIALVEAMALGCVPVVSDQEALPEIVGDTGIVVPYGDVKATSAAIKKAMEMDGNLSRARALKFCQDGKKQSVKTLFGCVERQI